MGSCVRWCDGLLNFWETAKAWQYDGKTKKICPVERPRLNLKLAVLAGLSIIPNLLAFACETASLSRTDKSKEVSRAIQDRLAIL
jgi:hypothetical protein